MEFLGKMLHNNDSGIPRTTLIFTDCVMTMKPSISKQSPQKNRPGAVLTNLWEILQ